MNLIVHSVKMEGFFLYVRSSIHDPILGTDVSFVLHL